VHLTTHTHIMLFFIIVGSDVVQTGGTVSLPSVSVIPADMQVTKNIAKSNITGQ